MVRRRALLLMLVVAVPALTSSAQSFENVTVLDTLDPQAPDDYNDVWGYVDEFGNEYALLGVQTGLSVINVSVPTAVYEAGFIPGVPSIWRDVKVNGDYAYVVTEGSGGGLQIVDLTNPESPSLASTWFGFDTAHNLYIEEATGRAYVCGLDTNNGGVLVLDVESDPLLPAVLGSWNTTYVHDLYVENNVGYISEIYVSGFSVMDFSNPAFSSRIAGPVTYAGAFNHNTWLDSATDILFTTDEIRNGHVRLWDLSALPAVTPLGEYQSNDDTIVHNVTVHDGKAYIAYYEDGLRIFEYSDPTAPAQVGAYDHSAMPVGNYDGAWGIYPFLPSGSVLVSDVQDGLYVFQHSEDYGLVQGIVSEDGVGTAVVGASVSLVENGKQYDSTGVGSFTMAAAPGAYTLRVEAFGFATQQIPLNVSQGNTTAANVSLVRLPAATLSGRVRGLDAGQNQSNLADALVEVVGTPLSTTSAADGTWSIPQTPLDPHTLRVTRNGYGRASIDVDVTSGGTGQDLLLSASPIYLRGDDPTGWAVGVFGDTAARGLWEHGVPIPSGGGLVQPGVDDTPDGADNLCFFTGNAADASSAIGAQDVDGGYTTLITPVLNATGMTDPHVAYSRWYVNEAGSFPASDVFTVEISVDNGANWTVLEQLFEDAIPWTRVTFRVADFAGLTGSVMLRFTADDAPGGSIVEAAIDDVELYDPQGTIVATSPRTRPAPTEFLSAWPNPFNPTTELSFRVAEPGRVKISIVDLRGRLVATLLDERMEAGLHRRSWRGVDQRGESVGSGVYLAILQDDSSRSVRKLVLSK